MPVSQKIEYEMQRISVNLTNGCDENQLNYNNDLPAIIGNKSLLKMRSIFFKEGKSNFFD